MENDYFFADNFKQYAVLVSFRPVKQLEHVERQSLILSCPGIAIRRPL